MTRQTDHLRGLLNLPACGQRKGARIPRTSDFVDFSDSIRLGFACKRCMRLWETEKAVREEFIANRETYVDAELNLKG